jgi:Carboxypeptidase regulatory-like domain/TonB-dependent Receptor Plug Domain
MIEKSRDVLVAGRKAVIALLLFGLGFALCPAPSRAQLGNAGSIEGTVKDPSGLAVAGAKVEITNPVSGFHREATTDTDGAFRFVNVPFNPYHLVVMASGFNSYTQDVDVRSTVPMNLQAALKIGSAAATTVTVEANGGDLVETESTFHTDVDQAIIDKLPVESASSSFTSIATLVSPGVAADSNGLMHGLGDHAENSVSLDGQPITDQFSKVFSNQLPSDAIQSMEIISGAPPAEFGDKTSLVIKATTKSGLGVTTPTGTVYSSYGSFGTANVGFNLAYGTQKWGNFIAANGLNSGRFLDPPEFQVIHAKGNEENIFDRFDYQFSQKDTLHLNLNYTRSWFQTPNAFDNLNVTDVNGNAVGNTDQRSKIGTYNIAPVWTRLISPTTVFTFGAFVRHDTFNYYPSPNPLADFSPIQSESIAQDRKLTNAGLRSDVSYVKGIHNIKVGVTYEHTFLTENDNLAIVNPTLNSPCLDAAGNPQTGFTDPTQCVAAGLTPNDGTNPNATVSPFIPLLGCFDLTRPTPAATADGCANTTSSFHLFHGHTDVKELALYAQDTITKNNWSFNLGIRGDVYNGITHYSQPEPRLGVAYNIKATNTVLRLSYARIVETPFNENLVLASNGCNDPVVNGIFTASSGGSPCLNVPLHPAWRNEFHAGFQQAFGKYFVIDAEYLWKYTHYGFDFSILGNTPVTFPVEWQSSKIPGYAIRASVPNYHGFSALVVMSGVAARFFQPQISGLGVTPGGQGGTGVFRIDHDEKFNQTTHLQYQFGKRGPWLGFNWRYDSGLVVSGVPDAGAALGLTGNQQVTIGLACNGVFATVANPLSPANCPAGPVTSKLITLPQGGFNGIASQENDDHNPDRVKARNLFDVALGDDNLFRGDRYRWSLRFTVVNVTNKVALYNFLSSFTGTHFVTPRAESVELGFHF